MDFATRFHLLRTEKGLSQREMRRVIERHVQKIEAHADGSFDVYVGLSLPLVAGAGNNPCLQLFRYRAV